MNCDLTQTTYFREIQEFLTAIASSITNEDFNKQEGVVEMATENLVLRIAPHALVENTVEPAIREVKSAT